MPDGVARRNVTAPRPRLIDLPGGTREHAPTRPPPPVLGDRREPVRRHGLRRVPATSADGPHRLGGAHARSDRPHLRRVVPGGGPPAGPHPGKVPADDVRRRAAHRHDRSASVRPPRRRLREPDGPDADAGAVRHPVRRPREHASRRVRQHRPRAPRPGDRDVGQRWRRGGCRRRSRRRPHPRPSGTGGRAVRRVPRLAAPRGGTAAPASSRDHASPRPGNPRVLTARGCGPRGPQTVAARQPHDRAAPPPRAQPGGTPELFDLRCRERRERSLPGSHRSGSRPDPGRPTPGEGAPAHPANPLPDGRSRPGPLGSGHTLRRLASTAGGCAGPPRQRRPALRPPRERHRGRRATRPGHPRARHLRRPRVQRDHVGGRRQHLGLGRRLRHLRRRCDGRRGRGGRPADSRGTPSGARAWRGHGPYRRCGRRRYLSSETA